MFRARPPLVPENSESECNMLLAGGKLDLVELGEELSSTSWLVYHLVEHKVVVELSINTQRVNNLAKVEQLP